MPYKSITFFSCYTDVTAKEGPRGRNVLLLTSMSVGDGAVGKGVVKCSATTVSLPTSRAFCAVGYKYSATVPRPATHNRMTSRKKPNPVLSRI